MTQQTAVEDQVIDIVCNAHICGLEDVTQECTNLTWNHVVPAVDRLSRRGEILLVPKGLGTYCVTFPLPEGRSA